VERARIVLLARQPDRKGARRDRLLALDLTEAGVRVRTGPPDDERDLPAPVWAGLLPIRTVVGEPEPCPLPSSGVPVPARVRDRGL
jgi:hypothetical protein